MQWPLMIKCLLREVLQVGQLIKWTRREEAVETRPTLAVSQPILCSLQVSYSVPLHNSHRLNSIGHDLYSATRHLRLNNNNNNNNFLIFLFSPLLALLLHMALKYYHHHHHNSININNIINNKCILCVIQRLFTLVLQSAPFLRILFTTETQVLRHTRRLRTLAV